MQKTKSENSAHGNAYTMPWAKFGITYIPANDPAMRFYNNPFSLSLSPHVFTFSLPPYS